MRAATSILCAWRWVDRRPTSYGSITHPEVSHKVLLFIGLKAVFYEDPLFACIAEAKLMNSEIPLTCKLDVSVCSPWQKWWPFRLLGATGAAWICESAREDKIRRGCKIAWRPVTDDFWPDLWFRFALSESGGAFLTRGGIKPRICPNSHEGRRVCGD